MAFSVSAEGPGSTVETGPCPICQDEALFSFVQQQRLAGHGYRRIWRMAKGLGYLVGKHKYADHCAHATRADSAVYGIGDAQDNAEKLVDVTDYFTQHGINLPPEGWKVRAATIEERSGNGDSPSRHWVRIAPESEDEDERIEVRQAEPVIIQGTPPSPTVFVRGDWKTWITTPDLQGGYWQDSSGAFHTIHDERAVDLSFQIARAVADSEGLHGWLDVGDFMDAAAFSTHKKSPGDMGVHVLNKSIQRLSEILAMRRWIVGPEGDLVVTGGNHDIRLANQAANLMPWIVGLRRADDPEDEHPVLSVPYLCRFRDHGVRYISSYPGGFYRLNSNLVAMHAPVYASQVLGTAKKLSQRIQSSVIYGHIHSREAWSHGVDTPKGNRTFELWSDGTLARDDGSVPSAKSTFNNHQDRLIASMLADDEGLLHENWQKGCSVVHVDGSERGLFSREPVIIWDSWCQFRGVDFHARVDCEGQPETAIE